ncbi:carbohydrate phosphatase [Apiospora phragmitis]|uniref:Carbohydrate phosphatase n=1 Tax=Apiospora phragmitis TaxID=2905665 RepID=A0ABR1TB93_9PEZI
MSDTTKLLDFLQQRVPADDASHKMLCTTVLPALVDAVADIARVLRAASAVSQVGTANAFGDDQLNVDISSEEAVRKALDSCSAVVTASSEEDPVEKPNGCRPEWPPAHAEDDAREEVYTVAFDPLDGSSIIAPNWSVGTILGVWRGASALHQSPKQRQVAAVLGVYGPRTTAVVALRIPGTSPLCFEVAVGEQGADDSLVVRADVKFADAPFKTRYFAPANLRAAAEDENYMKLVTHYIQNKYTLRYSGGLVPDVVHALVKGHGVYVSPVTAASKAKLRRLYELFPLALIVECAGGKAIDPATGSDILEHASVDTDERAGLVCGTAEEVEFVSKSLLG